VYAWHRAHGTRGIELHTQLEHFKDRAAIYKVPPHLAPLSLTVQRLHAHDCCRSGVYVCERIPVSAFLSAFDTCLRVSVTCLRPSVKEGAGHSAVAASESQCFPASVSPLTPSMQARLQTVRFNKMAQASPPRPTYPCRCLSARLAARTSPRWPALFLQLLVCSWILDCSFAPPYSITPCAAHAPSFARAFARLVLLGQALVAAAQTSKGA